ncbi:alpha-mannosidase [Kribbella pittospori]|uniref:Alpha-mannosidase n=1 Tax=Kribbella pittospori TaxID=722689 RepID=A0A4R0KEL4_9ACTN|nr:alpha-mannosidase [Kribbella pittospori]TCC58190.1 alpha-mannosidase [Kribbella pittospori]
MTQTGARGPLHMIGNAHTDAVWLWQWQEGFQEVRATFRSALDRMDEYPDYVFTADSVAYLSWIDEHDPELFERIRKRVTEGRFEIVGGWWVEPDCNLPGGEAFVRHALYSQRWLAEHLGVIATVGCNVDPFGHNATLPQLLSKARLDSYAFLRPQRHERELPGQKFWWEAADGSRVLAYRIPHEYCSPGGEISGHVTKAVQQLPVTTEPLMVFYGVGNHGGGPTIENIESIKQLAERDLFPEMFPSTMRRFFDEARTFDGIPVHASELQPHAIGCYAAHSGIKRQNRLAEQALLAAEKWATVAAEVSGMPDATAELGHAWKQVLFNQFHDIAAGTAIEPAYDDARDQLGEAKAIAARLANRSIQSIARQIDIPAESAMVPVAVFNPHAWPVTATVELELGYPAPLRGAIALSEGLGGRPIAVQEVRSTATANGRRRIAFKATLPPLGYQLYTMRPGDTSYHLGQPSDDRLRLDNGVVRAEIDPATGWLKTLATATGPNLLASGVAHAQVIDDDTDTWSHGVRSLWKTAGAFEVTRVRRLADGPVRQLIRVESAYQDSRLVEEFVLDAESDAVEVRVTVDWRERLKALKLCFPFALRQAEATHEIPYGHLVREQNREEVPSHAWVDVSGGEGGVAVLNDGKYSFAVDGSTAGRSVLAMTAVRSPVYAWHDPRRLDDDGVYEYLDQGLQRFTYRLQPHDGDWRAAGVVRRAAELNQPVTPLIECFHDGPLPASQSYLTVKGADHVAFAVVKRAEDNNGALIVRAHETAGRPAEATVTILGRTFDTAFRPHEVKTLQLPRDADAPPVDVDLLEWEPAEPPPVRGG